MFLRAIHPNTDTQRVTYAVCLNGMTGRELGHEILEFSNGQHQGDLIELIGDIHFKSTVCIGAVKELQ